MIRYRKATVDGVNLFYREAGAPEQPTLVLLHGFPSSSHVYRNLIPALADRFHVIAPDYPGFGNSDARSPRGFTYTFDRISELVEGLLAKLGVDRFGLFIQDYGSPVGFGIATRSPEAIEWIVWGKNNPILTPEGATAFGRDLPDAEIHLLDTGHFALEEDLETIVDLMQRFYTRDVAAPATAAA